MILSTKAPALVLVLAGLGLAAPSSAQYAEPPTSGANNTSPTKVEPTRLGRKDKEKTTGEPTSTDGRKYKLSKNAEKAIVELQTAVNSNDVAAIPGKLAAAQAVAKSPDEKFLVAVNQTKAAMNANDLAGIEAGINAMHASGVAEPADIVGRFTNLAKRHFDASHYDPAATLLDRALALNANHVPALKLLAMTRDKQGRKAEAVAAMMRSIAASKAAGTPVGDNEYLFALGLAHASKLPVATQIAREWVSAYPSAKSWHDALRVHRDIGNLEGQALIDHFRMAQAAGGLNTTAEYYRFASALFEAGAAAEAKAVLADAKAKGVNTNTVEFRDLAGRLTGIATRAQIDTAAKAALAGSSAKAAIAAGDSYYGIGAYADAGALYRAALGKSGVDSNLANLRLGMALARAGDKAGATAALNAVAGARSDTAKFWLVWLSRRA